MTDKHLDDAIDCAAREIMNVDGNADVKARVLRRLEHRAPQFLTWPRLGAVAAAALLLAFALMPGPKPDPVPATAKAPEPIAAPVAPKRTGPEHSQPSEGPSAQASPGPRRRTDRRLAAAVATEVPSTIPALVMIEPLVVEPPTPRDIERKAIDIAPLPAIAVMHVEPLSPPGGRD